LKTVLKTAIKPIIMNKSVLAAFACAAILSACSSHPTDYRPGNKVSVDSVTPGTRETDIYNLNGQEATAHDAHGHEAAGHEAAAHEAAADTTHRPDVMLNHDEHASDVNGKKEVPAKEKTTDAEHVENHE
jgi:hypothetical protein